MRRTEALQGVRVIKFRSVLDRYESRDLNQIEAAELLGITERTFRRWCHRYEEAGDAGLLDRRLGGVSGKRVPVDRSEEVEALYRARYSGFTARHFHEHLVRDHQFSWGYTWTKLFLQSKGLLVRAKTRGAHRRKRPRRPIPGMMLHQDGSRHEWLAGHDAMDLIVTMDDATNVIYSAFLLPEEAPPRPSGRCWRCLARTACRSVSTPIAAAITSTHPRPAAALIARTRRRLDVRWRIWVWSISQRIRPRRVDDRSACFTPYRTGW
jgi:transposase